QELVPAADGHHRAGRGGRGQRRMTLVARAQGDQVVGDLPFGDLPDGGDTGGRQVRQVAIEVAAVGQQGVASQTPFDGQVVEVAAQCASQRRRGFDRVARGGLTVHRGGGHSPAPSGSEPAATDPGGLRRSATPGSSGANADSPSALVTAGPADHRSSAGLSSAPVLSARCAASRPATAEELTIVPANTAATASSRKTRTIRRSDSSSSAPEGRPASLSLRARKTRTASSVNPGELATSTSTAQVAAAIPVSSSSSRCAVTSGGSSVTSIRPAGSSHSRRRKGCRYCSTRTTRSSSSR